MSLLITGVGIVTALLLEGINSPSTRGAEELITDIPPRRERAQVWLLHSRYRAIPTIDIRHQDLGFWARRTMNAKSPVFGAVAQHCSHQ